MLHNQKSSQPANQPTSSQALLGASRVLNSYIAADLVGFLVSSTELTALLSRRSKAPEGLEEINGGYAWRFSFEAPAQNRKPMQQLKPHELSDHLLSNLFLETSSGKNLPRQASKTLSGVVSEPDPPSGAVSEPDPPSGAVLEPASNPAPPRFPRVPLFAQLGQHNQADTLLNLSYVQHLSIRGPAEAVSQTMGSLAMDLLSYPYRRDLQVYMVGFGDEFAMFPQVLAFDKLSDALDFASQPRQAYGSQPVGEHAGGNPASIFNSTSVSGPAVVMFAPMVESASMIEEATLRNISLVTSHEEAPWLLELGDRTNRLHPLDIEFAKPPVKRPADVPTETFLTMLALHDTLDDDYGLSYRPHNLRGRDRLSRRRSLASQRPGLFGGFVRPASSSRLIPRDRLPLTGSAPGEPRKVRVCVLGPVKVEGIDPSAPQQCQDIICFLAFHREGVTREMVLESLWEDGRQPHMRTVTSLISRTRLALGKGSQNQPLLPRIDSDKAYRLSAEVTTDYDEFCRHLLRVRRDGPAAVVHLRRALRLVRGAPFHGPVFRRYNWADFSLRLHMECQIDETAHRLADIALAMRDPLTALWACKQAHKVVPGCEQCYARRFQIARQQGSRVELQNAMAELHHIVAADTGCQVSPQMFGHYHDLMQSRVW